jgi:hypothetical protein
MIRAFRSRMPQLSVTILLMLPSPVAAQVCGSLPGASDHVIAHRAVFTEERYADARAALEIKELDRHASVRLVPDTATCERIMAREVAMMGTPGIPDSETYAIYQYGAYFAIEYCVPRSKDRSIRIHGWQRLRVYAADSYELVGTMNLPWDAEPRNRRDDGSPWPCSG